MQSAREAERQAVNLSRSGYIAETAQDWEALSRDVCDIEVAAKRMKVSEEDAVYYLFLAHERIRGYEQENRAVRSRPTLSEALQIWGADGIMRTKSRIRYERSFPLPQSMA